MKINVYSNKNISTGKYVDINIDGGNVFIEVSQQEAISLIYSLSAQIKNRSPNMGRLESYDDKGIYFSIAVNEETK